MFDEGTRVRFATQSGEVSALMRGRVWWWENGPNAGRVMESDFRQWAERAMAGNTSSSFMGVRYLAHEEPDVTGDKEQSYRAFAHYVGRMFDPYSLLELVLQMWDDRTLGTDGYYARLNIPLFEQIGRVLLTRHCACGGGVLWPIASDEDTRRAWVERCDSCGVYESDVAAAEALCRRYPDLQFALSEDGNPYIKRMSFADAEEFMRTRHGG
jgi:hypothetical protein